MAGGQEAETWLYDPRTDSWREAAASYPVGACHPRLTTAFAAGETWMIGERREHYFECSNNFVLRLLRTTLNQKQRLRGVELKP